tara:strand:- start:97 stop:807 length:711 start_codon:yes stop_codon:yes gene_type:complete
MATILITGANRGIGLEYVRQYQAQGAVIHACCRNPEEASDLQNIALNSKGNISIHRMEVTNSEQINTLASTLKDVAIDLLINNAGILGTVIDKPEPGAFGSVNYDVWEEVMRVNVLGPFRVCEAFVNHVAASDQKLMVFISTHMSSITELQDAGYYPYRSSKAALNLLVKGLSLDLSNSDIRTLAMHPGWVKTDMGSQAAAVETNNSVSGMLKVIMDYDAPRTGEFINYDNTPIQW